MMGEMKKIFTDLAEGLDTRKPCPNCKQMKVCKVIDPDTSKVTGIECVACKLARGDGHG